ncbi:HNH endonuclease [Deinococcus marmoris]|uniref:HNH endonuclease n=1 Tax=Deinococcus marmoris TaxID=249408 RepID=UPI000494FAD7|nr:HNH endonuclease [Deinococcus marmoris]
MHEGREVLATLLRHEAKSNTYKFALIRALNDLALDHPWLPEGDVVVPLRRVAERWLVSYWPFVGEREIQQGARSRRDGVLRQDISFRAALTQVRLAWETLPYARSHPADGALLLAEYQAGRGRLSPELRTLTQQALVAIAQAVKQPVKFAGTGGVHKVFGPLAPVATLPGVPLPGAQPGELAFAVPATLWQALQALSLWVEALCLQQWSLFIERVDQRPRVTRGETFTLLTATPDARVPLTWERNQVRLLLLEGTPLACPWTGHVLCADAFNLDHLIPVSVHPINELWNLVPSDPRHNQHVKRARIPGEERLRRALPILTQTYAAYTAAPGMAVSFQEDVRQRFGSVLPAPHLAQEVIRISDAVAQARNVPRY